MATRSKAVDAYRAFVGGKLALRTERAGIDLDDAALSRALFPFQRDLVRWALATGKAALFAACGLGKTGMQLEWAHHANAMTGGDVLVLAPLAVSQQTVREGEKFGRLIRYAGDAGAIAGPLTITNYERLDKFDPARFAAVVLDESGIIKNFTGKVKGEIFEAFQSTPYKLACSATPAPNDHMELGQHAEFLDVLTSHEMLARWFINDQSSFGTYRLKGHAARDFWDWVCSWARCVTLPSDLGHPDDGYVLPALSVDRHVVDVDVLADRGDALFRTPDMSATAVHKEKRRTAPDRARKVAEIVAREPGEAWLIWCETDYEEDALRAVLPDAAVVNGKDPLEQKERTIAAFADGQARVLISKGSILGFGLNFQHCARQVLVGPTFSYERFHQQVKRSHRFGQTRPVRVHVVMGATEVAVWDVLMRKAEDHETMAREMAAATRRATARVDNRATAYDARARFELASWVYALPENDR